MFGLWGLSAPAFWGLEAADNILHGRCEADKPFFWGGGLVSGFWGTSTPNFRLHRIPRALISGFGGPAHSQAFTVWALSTCNFQCLGPGRPGRCFFGVGFGGLQAKRHCSVSFVCSAISWGPIGTYIFGFGGCRQQMFHGRCEADRPFFWGGAPCQSLVLGFWGTSNT